MEIKAKKARKNYIDNKITNKNTKMRNHKLVTLGLSMMLCGNLFANKIVTINGVEVTKDAASITLSGDNAILRYTDGTTFTTDMSGLLVTFDDKTKAQNTPADYYLINTIVENELDINGMELCAEISIIATNGKIMLRQQADGTTAKINVSQLPTGVYLLKVNNQSIKFVKK